MPRAGALGAPLEDDHLSPDPLAAPGAAPAPGPLAPSPSGDSRAPLLPLPSDALLDAVTRSLDDDKAVDVVSIDLRGRSEMGDWMVIASGRSSRQVAAIAEHLADRLKQEHGLLAKTEGKEAGDWVLVDAGDVIVHVFRPEVRDFYQLEKMWLAPGDGGQRRPAPAAGTASA